MLRSSQPAGHRPAGTGSVADHQPHRRRWLERFTQLELLGLGHIELELRPRPEFECIVLWHSRRGLPLATPAGAAVQPEVVKCSDL